MNSIPFWGLLKVLVGNLPSSIQLQRSHLDVRRWLIRSLNTALNIYDLVLKHLPRQMVYTPGVREPQVNYRLVGMKDRYPRPGYRRALDIKYNNIQGFLAMWTGLMCPKLRKLQTTGNLSDPPPTN